MSGRKKLLVKLWNQCPHHENLKMNLDPERKGLKINIFIHSWGGLPFHYLFFHGSSTRSFTIKERERRRAERKENSKEGPAEIKSFH